MKNIFIYLLLTFSILIAHGDGDNHDHGHQQKKISQMGAIKGKVVDLESQKIISYASISIYRSKSKKLVQGGISDEDGYFTIDRIPPGNFMMTIEFIGYEMKTIENIRVNRTDGMIKGLGVISLVPRAIEAEEIRSKIGRRVISK